MEINHQPFLDSNAEIHRVRVFGVPWWKSCSLINVDKLRVQVSVELRRLNGGLNYEEKQILKLEVAKIQNKKERQAVRIEAREKTYYENLRKAI